MYREAFFFLSMYGMSTMCYLTSVMHWLVSLGQSLRGHWKPKQISVCTSLLIVLSVLKRWPNSTLLNFCYIILCSHIQYWILKKNIQVLLLPSKLSPTYVIMSVQPDIYYNISIDFISNKNVPCIWLLFSTGLLTSKIIIRRHYAVIWKNR